MQELTILILILTVLLYGATLVIYQKAYHRARKQIKELERANSRYYMETRRDSGESLY